jgi:hypothetical protein
MKRLIRVLVFAPDENGALDAAHKLVYEKLKTTKNGGPFDIYFDFTEGRRVELKPCMSEEEKAAFLSNWPLTKGISAKEQWGPIPPVSQVSTILFPTEDTRGMEQVRAALKQIRKEFKHNMALIRYHVANYTDDELFKEVQGKGEVEIDGVRLYDDPKCFQYYCKYLGGQIPEEGYLFDSTGRCVTHLAYLRRIITGTDENPFFIDESEGENSKWGRPFWNMPLWIVPFHFLY